MYPHKKVITTPVLFSFTVVFPKHGSILALCIKLVCVKQLPDWNLKLNRAMLLTALKEALLH